MTKNFMKYNVFLALFFLINGKDKLKKKISTAFSSAISQ
jgi:hypothetical protein